MPVLTRIVGIMLLRAGPQHLPYSVPLMLSLVLLYVVSGVAVLDSSMDTNYALGNMLLDVVVLFAFTWFCLSLLKFRQRFVQTIIALAGIGVVYHLLAWPLLLDLQDMQAEAQGVKMSAVLMLLLLSWQVLVYGHVFRHAMVMSMSRALALSFGYLFLSIAVADIVFPGA
jgi:hypothetical protein